MERLKELEVKMLDRTASQNEEKEYFELKKLQAVIEDQKQKTAEKSALHKEASLID